MQRGQLPRLLTVGVLLASAAIVVALAAQKRMLEARVLELSSRLRDPYPGFLVPPLPVTTLRGDSVVLASGGEDRLQLLLAFTTTCEACAASIPPWKELARGLRERDAPVEVFGLALDSAEPSLAHELPFPVVRFAEPRTRALYRLRRVPAVVLVDGLGRVRYVRFGALGVGVALDSVHQAVVEARAEAAGRLAATADLMDSAGGQGK